VDVKRVGRELGVRYVLEGSVRKSAHRLRINGQLIDASTGAHLWADRFDGALENIFDLQDQVTANVVGAIAPKLELAEIERVKRKPTESLDAYDYFLRGMAGLHKWSREGNDEAISHFYRAIDLDRNFAAAHGLAARAYVQRNSGGWITDRAHEIGEAARLARRAVELGQDDALALCTAGFALADICGEVTDGDAFIDKAIELNPNLAWAWVFSGWVKASIGKPDIALQRLARAVRLSPNDPQAFSAQAAMAFAHFIAGQYAEGLSRAEAAERNRPSYLLPKVTAAACAALGGRLTEARNAVARIREIDSDFRISKVGTLQYMQPDDLARWAEGLRIAGLPE
jgi:tetratricopeptide (TPR) repeat protein